MASAVFALLAAALALGAPPTTLRNQALAHRDARQLLRRVVLPEGAQQSAAAPAALRHPFQQPGTRELVDEHALWRVQEPLDRVVAFASTHVPRGSRLQVQSTGTSAHGLGFAFRALPGRLSTRIVLVTMAALPGGWTGIRVDAQDVWVVTRPRDEVVPAGVREIVIRNPQRLLHRVSDPVHVARIVRWFDRLPVAQPGVTYPCPLVRGPLITIEFRGAAGTVLARAAVEYDGGTSGPCNAISFSIRGRKQAPLVGGRFLVRVQRLLGPRR